MNIDTNHIKSVAQRAIMPGTFPVSLDALLDYQRIAGPVVMLELLARIERLTEQADTLHAIGTALGLPPGTDLTRHTLPAVLALLGHHHNKD